jgi:hypothetical protein
MSSIYAIAPISVFHHHGYTPTIILSHHITSHLSLCLPPIVLTNCSNNHYVWGATLLHFHGYTPIITPTTISLATHHHYSLASPSPYCHYNIIMVFPFVSPSHIPSAIALISYSIIVSSHYVLGYIIACVYTVVSSQLCHCHYPVTHPYLITDTVTYSHHAYIAMVIWVTTHVSILPMQEIPVINQLSIQPGGGGNMVGQLHFPVHCPHLHPASGSESLNSCIFCCMCSWTPPGECP